MTPQSDISKSGPEEIEHKYVLTSHRIRFWLKIIKNYEHLQKITKTLTCLNWIAAKIMKKYKKNKTIYIFEFDCSENHEKI